MNANTVDEKGRPRFTEEGGHIYALREDEEDGYQKTVLSVELERGQEPWVVVQGREMTREEIESLMRVVIDVYGR
jgi:hypothetical protein